jgi:hypothetical protein
VAAQVDQRGARAVRDAVQVDPAVAQGGAHGLQVLHRLRGRVERGIRAKLAEPAQALAERVHRQEVAEIGLQVVVAAGQRAVETVRAAGAAQIHEDHVALAPRLLQELGEHGGVGDGRLPRAAGNGEDRVRRRRGGPGGEHRDLQRDPASGWNGVILGDLQRAAAGILLEARELAGSECDTGRRLRLHRSRAQRHQKRTSEHEEGDGHLRMLYCLPI